MPLEIEIDLGAVDTSDPFYGAPDTIADQFLTALHMCSKKAAETAGCGQYAFIMETNNPADSKYRCQCCKHVGVDEQYWKNVTGPILVSQQKACKGATNYRPNPDKEGSLQLKCAQIIYPRIALVNICTPLHTRMIGDAGVATTKQRNGMNSGGFTCLQKGQCKCTKKFTRMLTRFLQQWLMHTHLLCCTIEVDVQLATEYNREGIVKRMYLGS